jgi:hypothetical protein
MNKYIPHKLAEPISHLELVDLISYEAESGVFTWVKSRVGVKKGSIAGTKRPDGYIYIGINKLRYYAHRLAWFYMYHEWPKGDLDHINGDTSDNRICNLREVTRRQNLLNMRGRPSSSGVKGVTQCRKTLKWGVNFRVEGVKKNFGCYKTKGEAEQIARLKREQLHGEFANHG